MPRLTIDGMEIEVEPGTSVLQAAEALGIEVPRFCYHERLSVPGNCRMCLVEVEGGPPKPQPSCSLPVSDGMVVHTSSDMVKEARRGVMENILINHPLDCPVCDQGGECDLQDQAFAYGADRSRYRESKRAVAAKDFGPLIKTDMTRCIQCTRCIRFCEEIAGTAELGYFNRGEDAEVSTFGNAYVTTELSGNLADICPVGALTSKPYAYRARPWELSRTDSVDVHDALGSNIRIDSRDNEVMRILPRLHEGINEVWLDDRARFSCDGLARGRIDRPYIKDRKSGKLEPVEWDRAFAYIAENLKGFKGEQMAALTGDMCDVESMLALKDLMKSLSCGNIDCRTDGGVFETSDRGAYLFNSGIAGVEKADAILIIGSNPRREAALLNARIRKAWLKNRTKIALIGQAADLTYPYEHLGTGPNDLEKLLNARSGFAKTMREAERPMVILGSGALCRSDGLAIHTLAVKAAMKFGAAKEGWRGFNLLHRAASRVGALDVGFLPAEGGRGFESIIEGTRTGAIGALYLLGADEFDARAAIGWKTFVIYQGHHGDYGADRADVILPGCACTEKDGLYVNTEGRVQQGRRAVGPPGQAKEDWKIIRALSEVLGKKLPYDTHEQLVERLTGEWHHFNDIDRLPGIDVHEISCSDSVLGDVFEAEGEDFYLSNPICRASESMRRASQAFVHGKRFDEAAE